VRRGSGFGDVFSVSDGVEGFLCGVFRGAGLLRRSGSLGAADAAGEVSMVVDISATGSGKASVSTGAEIGIGVGAGARMISSGTGVFSFSSTFSFGCAGFFLKSCVLNSTMRLPTPIWEGLL
jgi:hypothetical protein